MKLHLRLVAAAILLVAASRSISAQQQTTPPATSAAPGYEFHGSADVGYRFMELDGSTDAYREVFNLTDGLRLFSLDLRGDAPKIAGGFADTFVLSASGVGDPFPTVQLTARKSHRYDVRFNWRQSQWFSAWPVTPTSIAGLDTQAVTDHHSWNTRRQVGDANATFDVSNRLHLQAGYARVARNGSLESTRSLDFVGSPATWGSFARANPYTVMSPVDDSTNRLTGGLSFGHDRWTVNYRAGYEWSVERQGFTPVATQERSINVADPTTSSEILSALQISQKRQLGGPLSEFSYVVQPHGRVEWRGEYLLARHSGPFSEASTYQGQARSNAGGTSFSPYSAATTADGEVTVPSQVLTQGLGYVLTGRWSLDVRYRYSRLSSEARGQLGSLLTGYPIASAQPEGALESDDLTWKQTLHAVDVTTTIEPTAALTIRPGIGFSQRDIESRADGILQAATSERIRAAWPELTLGYRPGPRFSARASYGASYSDAWYTRMSPVRRIAGRAAVKVEPIEGLAFDFHTNVTAAELPGASFVSHTGLASGQLSYRLSDRLTVLGGLDYQHFLGVGNVSFLRGALPIADDEMRDQETDRIWQVGGTVKIGSRVGVTATGNFLTVLGTDTIAGEPPLYGPESLFYGTGSVYVDVPRVGQLIVDLQRTHLYQDLLPLNNFSATLLTFRYSRGFGRKWRTKS